MGNSLDYIKYRVLERKDTNLDIAFDNVFEISPKKFLKLDERNQVSIVLKSLENISDTPEGDITVQIAYNPNADFSYFTTSSSIHDGTLLFVYENINDCIVKILTLQTYDKRIGIPEDATNYNYFYTIGDIVVVNEFDDRFAPAEKPWMRQRTTVMVPIVFRYEEKRGLGDE